MQNKLMFTPTRIGNCEIPNRFVVTAMLTGLCGFDGKATEEYIRYHEARARGGWGLIITEDYRVVPAAANSPRAAGLWNDDQIEGHRQLTQRVHKFGSKIFCQLYHAGRQTNRWITGEQPVAASPSSCPVFKDMTRELSVEEIHDMVARFGSAAGRAKAAGFDGLEIHAGNGYLLAGFMSVYQNKRTDEYGGCFNNRMRFLREVVEACRAAVGPDFPIMVRFSVQEHTPSGRMLMESRMVARELETWGVDAVNCSNGIYGSYLPMQSSTYFQEHGWAMPNARELKSFLNIPVLGSNGVDDPLMAETYIADGWCDLVGMARCSLADPDMPNKAREGRYEEIRPCIRCMKCFGELVREHLHCCVNPEMGRETQFTYEGSPYPKRVLVVGGGPGGMYAAIGAARRGHKVTLWEASDKLGGQFIAASYAPAKGDHISFICYLVNELRKQGVTVELNKRGTAEDILSFGADKVILATGGTPRRPDVPGVELPKVCYAEDVLRGRCFPMGRILVVGAGETAVETALYLAAAERGDITLAARKGKLIPEVDGNTAASIRKSLHDFEVNVRVDTRTKAITEAGAVLEHDGLEREEEFNFVVLGTGFVPNNSLAAELEALCEKLVVVGDASAVADAMKASVDGLTAGYNA